MTKYLVFILLIPVLLYGCGGGRSAAQSQTTPTAFYSTKGAPADSPVDDSMSPQELQAAIMAYADTTNSRMAEVAALLDKIGTPQARLTAARMMVFNISSNVEIAAGPYPGVALLDMIVITTLRRMTWEEYWIPEVFGEEARPALAVIREAEAEVWEVAAKIMTQEQMDELAAVIIQWREKNPHQYAVNWVRFAEFGELGLKPSMRTLTVPGGLFASVAEATMIAQDMKVAIDRAFYLMSRMQLVISFQIKLAYLETVFQPEADGLIKSTEKMTGITERYAEIAEKLPTEVREEASILINQLFANLQVQRDDTIEQALAGITTWQSTMVEDVMSNVAKEREAALDQALAGITQQQEALFKQMEMLVNISGGQVENLVDSSGNQLEATLNHAFLLGVFLILIFFVLLTLYRVLVVRPLNKRSS